MQNKNYKLCEFKKPKISQVNSPIIKSRTLYTDRSKFNDRNKVSSSHKLIPFVVDSVTEVNNVITDTNNFYKIPDFAMPKISTVISPILNRRTLYASQCSYNESKASSGHNIVPVMVGNASKVNKTITYNRKKDRISELSKPKIPKVTAPTIKSRILYTHQSKYKKMTKLSSSQNLVPFVKANESEVNEDEKTQVWQKIVLETFDKFLLQLDELLMNLRTQENLTTIDYVPLVENYKVICERLRTEILIAMDKIELNARRNFLLDQESDFLKKMNCLKSQLSQLRWQYHKAIQELNLVKQT